MRTKAFLLLAGAVVACAGCVRTLNPLADADHAVFDPALAGTWQSADGGESWVFSGGEGSPYELVYTDRDGQPARFRATLVALGGERFLDFHPAETPPHPNGFYQWHVLLAHSFVHVPRVGPVLEMRFPDADWLKQRLAEDPGALDHAYLGDELVLTAPTPALQAFWQRHAGTDGAFEAPVSLRRQGAGGGG